MKRPTKTRSNQLEPRWQHKDFNSKTIWRILLTKFGSTTIQSKQWNIQIELLLLTFVLFKLETTLSGWDLSIGNFALRYFKQ